MSSKIARRSGNAVTDYCSLIGWKPNQIHIVGVGAGHGEVESFQERWPGVPIIGYEPHPWTYPGLMATGRFQEVYNVAISNYVGKSVLYGKKRWKNGASILKPTSHTPDQEFSVNVTTLDEMSKILGEVRQALLWLDCEGCELRALEGGEKFVQNVLAVNVEMTGRARGEDWCSPTEVHEWLINNGFFQSLVHTIRPVIGQFDSLYLREEVFNPDFCTCPDSVLRLKNVQRSRADGNKRSDLRRSPLCEDDSGD